MKLPSDRAQRQPTREGVQEVEMSMIVWLLSMKDGSGVASKVKVFRKQSCLRISSMESASATTTTDTISLGGGPGGVRCRTY